MINSLKVRSGFSIKNQISFILDLTNIQQNEPSLPLYSAISSLEGKFPYLVKVINIRIESGMKPLDALTSTLDNALVPYIQNDTLLLSATSGVCRILLSHNSMFVRRMVASFVIVMLTLAGVVMKEPILAIGSGFTLVLVDYICKPVTELHKDQKII